MENINNKAEKILREYVEFKDINQSEPVELLPLTIVDCMEDYAMELFVNFEKWLLNYKKDENDCYWYTQEILYCKQAWH